MAQYIVFHKLNNATVFAGEINDDGEFTYTFAVEEAKRFDWQADAMNAVRDRKIDYSVFLHDAANCMEFPSGLNWEYGAI